MCGCDYIILLRNHLHELFSNSLYYAECSDDVIVGETGPSFVWYFPADSVTPL